LVSLLSTGETTGFWTVLQDIEKTASLSRHQKSEPFR